MFKVHLKSWKLILSLALAAVLVTVLTLSVVAQEEADGGEPVNPSDKSTIVEEEELAEVGRATTQHLFISASGFVPHDDNMEWNYYGGGCVYHTAGSRYSDYNLVVPEGAEIDYIRLFFYDNDAVNDAAVFFYTFDGKGGNELIVKVESSGTPGYSSKGSGYLDPTHEVDYWSENLVLRLDYGGATTSALRICGVRVQYKYSALLSSFLPLIEN
jgi:hypothetical protein